MNLEDLKTYIDDNIANLNELATAPEEDRTEILYETYANFLDLASDIKQILRELRTKFNIREAKVKQWMKENDSEEQQEQEDQGRDSSNELNGNPSSPVELEQESQEEKQEQGKDSSNELANLPQSIINQKAGIENTMDELNKLEEGAKKKSGRKKILPVVQGKDLRPVDLQGKKLVFKKPVLVKKN